MINYENLEKLRDFLVLHKHDIEGRLNMDRFASYDLGDVDSEEDPLCECDEVCIGACEAINYDDLDLLDTANFGVHQCGTTACLVGWGAVSKVPALMPSDDDVGWGGYINRVYLEQDYPIYQFLFDPCWPDDLEQGIARIDYVVNHREIPYEFLHGDECLKFKLKIDSDSLKAFYQL